MRVLPLYVCKNCECKGKRQALRKRQSKDEAASATEEGKKAPKALICSKANGEKALTASKRYLQLRGRRGKRGQRTRCSPS